MTTTMPTPPTTPSAPPRLLRRSRSDRYGVGVCGGLGRYFDVDPVIFRVVIAVLAVFGGAGVALYLLLWAAIPDEGTTDSALDRAIAGLRRRRIPFGLVAVVAVVVVWAVGFSWWAPGAVVPLIVVGALLVVLLSQRRREPIAEPTPSDSEPNAPFARPAGEPSATGSELREWMAESRDRARARRRRSRPVRVTAFAALLLSVIGLAIIDATVGIPFAAYFWTVGGIVVAALLVGLITRRTPWSVTPLLVPVAVGLVAFGSSPAQAHDGWGDRTTKPTSVADLDTTYKQAFGQNTIDLSQLRTVDADRTVHITLAAGRIHLVLPRGVNVVVRTDVHMGTVLVDGTELHSGYNFSRDVVSSGPGPQLTIDARVATGAIAIDHV